MKAAEDDAHTALADEKYAEAAAKAKQALTQKSEFELQADNIEKARDSAKDAADKASKIEADMETKALTLVTSISTTFTTDNQSLDQQNKTAKDYQSTLLQKSDDAKRASDTASTYYQGFLRQIQDDYGNSEDTIDKSALAQEVLSALPTKPTGMDRQINLTVKKPSDDPNYLFVELFLTVQQLPATFVSHQRTLKSAKSKRDELVTQIFSKAESISTAETKLKSYIASYDSTVGFLQGWINAPR
ncbi:MAG: hypothetical protein HY711_08500 [Candidatus Melainabacteria bacterium]|nr:hypothetical protein [Candidatus Melainabacteria bacterium]